MCKKMGLPQTRRVKADLIAQILSPEESTQEKLKALVNLQLIREYRDRLLEYAMKVYTRRGHQVAAASNSTAAPGHDVFDLLNSLEHKIELTASQRLVLVLHGPMGKGKSFILNEVAMKGVPPEWSANAPLGQCGPLPSTGSSVSHSLTVIPVRIRYSPIGSLQLRTFFKDGSAPTGTQDFGLFTPESVTSLRSHIGGAQASEIHEFEISGPFPGIHHIEENVRMHLDLQDKALFVGIELVDIPGGADDHFPRQHQRQVLGSSDIILCLPFENRGFTTSDVVQVIQNGALPSYEQRSKLVVVENLSPGNDSKACDISCDSMAMATRALLGTHIDTLLRPSHTSQEDTNLLKNREILHELLQGSSVIKVKSQAEGEALMRKVKSESACLVFYSQQLEQLEPTFSAEIRAGYHSTAQQLATIILEELKTRVRYCRMYPLLDDVQKMGSLIKRKMSMLIHANPDRDAQLEYKLTKLFNAKLKDKAKQMKTSLRPVLEFASDRLDGLNLLSDLHTYQHRPAELQKLLATPSYMNELLRELQQTVEDSFSGMLDDLDDIVDSCIQDAKVDAVREDMPKGFLRPAVTIALKDKLAEPMLAAELKTRLVGALRQCIKPAMSLSKDIRTALTWISDEMDSESDSGTDAEVETDDEGDVSKDEKSENSQDGKSDTEPLTVANPSARLLLRLIVHRALDWAKVNQPRANKSPLRLRLKDTAQFVENTYLRQLTELFGQVGSASLQADIAAAPAAPVAAVVPTLSTAEAKAYCDEIDKHIVKRVRVAMQEFNPSFSLEDAGSDSFLTTSSEHFPEPQQFEPGKKTSDTQVDVGSLESCFLKNKKRFKLSEVLSLLCLTKKICVRKMAEAGIETDRSRQKPRENGQPESQKWAAALVRAAIELLSLPLAGFKDAAQAVLGEVDARHLLVAKDALWYLSTSRLSIQLHVVQPNVPFEVDDAFSGLRSVIAEERAAGNDIIVIRRNVRDFRFSATLTDQLHIDLQKLATAADGELCPIIIPSKRCGPGVDGSDVPAGNLWLDSFINDDKYSEEDRVRLGLEVKPATIIVLCEPRNISRFIRNFGVDSDAKRRHPAIRLVWALLPLSRAYFGIAVSIGKLLAEALSFSRYWTVDDDLLGVHQYENPGRWFLSSFRRCMMFGQQALEHATADCYQLLEDDARFECVDEGVKAAPEASRDIIRRQVNNLVNKAWHHYGLPLIRDPELLLRRVMEDASLGDTANLRALDSQTLNRVLDAVADRIKLLGRKSLDTIAGVSICHVRGKRSGYIHKGGNYRRSNQRYQFVLHNSAAIIGHNLVPDKALLAEHPWHTQMSDQQPAWYAKELDAYRHDSTNGCKTADHQFTRGLDAIGKHGYQVYNFTHLRIKFPQEKDDGNAWETTSSDTDSLMVESSEDEN